MNNFKKQYKVELEPIIMDQNTITIYNNGKVTKIPRRPRSDSEEPKKVTAKKGILNKMKKNMAILGVAGIAALAGVTAIVGVKHSKDYEPISTKESLELGNTPHKLGVTYEMIEELMSIRDILNEKDYNDLSEEEIMQLAKRVEELQLDIMKSKIAKAFNEKKEPDEEKVLPNDLKLIPVNPKDEMPAKIIKENDDGRKIYDYKLFESEMNFALATGINKIGEVQEITHGYVSENKKAYKILENAVDNIDKIAGADIVFENKKIVVKFTKQKQYDKQISQIKQVDDYEIGE